MKARTKFVEKVGEVMINQLLDDLIDEGVLNEGEKNHILSFTPKEETARKLIDAVKTKGDGACEILIDHLGTRDFFLCSVLGL